MHGNTSIFMTEHIQTDGRQIGLFKTFQLDKKVLKKMHAPPSPRILLCRNRSIPTSIFDTENAENTQIKIGSGDST